MGQLDNALLNVLGEVRDTMRNMQVTQDVAREMLNRQAEKEADLLPALINEYHEFPTLTANQPVTLGPQTRDSFILTKLLAWVNEGSSTGPAVINLTLGEYTFQIEYNPSGALWILDFPQDGLLITSNARSILPVTVVAGYTYYLLICGHSAPGRTRRVT